MAMFGVVGAGPGVRADEPPRGPAAPSQQVSDAPADYTAQLLQHIVGIELTIHRLQGKWKVSQNQPEANQRSVIAGLQGQGTEGSVRMAGMVAGRRAKPSARQTT